MPLRFSGERKVSWYRFSFRERGKPIFPSMSYIVNTKLKPLLDESALIHLINRELISADTILSELIKVNVKIK